MDACRNLFGRPWQFDNKVIHVSWKNTYTFFIDKKKIILVPLKEEATPKPKQGEGVNLLSIAKFEKDWKKIV